MSLDMDPTIRSVFGAPDGMSLLHLGLFAEELSPAERQRLPEDPVQREEYLRELMDFYKDQASQLIDRCIDDRPN